MIVVAIIGVLSTVAMPNYQKMVAKARQAEAKSALSAIYTVEKTYFAEGSTYTFCLYQGGYLPEGARRMYTTGYMGSVSACVECAKMVDSGQSCSFANQPWAQGTRNDSTFMENVYANPALNGAGVPVIFDVYPDRFNAGAMGSISTLGIYDLWQMDENRTLTNIQVGYLEARGQLWKVAIRRS